MREISIKRYLISLFLWALVIVGVIGIFSSIADAQTTGTLTFVWDANTSTDQVTEYRLYEKVGADYNQLAVIPASADPTYTLSNVTVSAHTYVVTAVNPWGESGYSNEVTTPSGLPGIPGSLTITITITINPEDGS